MPINHATITSVEFRNYKAFAQYSLRLQGMNVLVGPNNSGKSTILGAFRALETALRRARSKTPEIVDGPKTEVYGYRLSEDNLPISIENIHTDYAESDTTVTFRLSNANKLQLYFPRDGGWFLIPEPTTKLVRNVKSFNEAFPISIAVVPVLGPVEHKEELVQAETVQRNLNTHRASRNFRAYWHYFPNGFEEFSELVRKTWPGMDIEAPEVTVSYGTVLSMFCRESRITRELYWSGLGFQVWCQLLTHILREQGTSLFIVDEPDIYLHPDLQRQLVGMLRSIESDVVLATHSTEIISEADPSEIVLIDKTLRTAQRLRDVEGVQKVLSNIGSIQNITLTRLAKNRTILFVEGADDFAVIRGFARQLGFAELASGVDLTPVESGGFSSWERVKALGWGMERTLGKLAIGALYDRDYASQEEVDGILGALREHIAFAHVLDRKEMENYLLIPSALERAVRHLIADRIRRAEGGGEVFGIGEVDPGTFITSALGRITEAIRQRVLGLYIGRRSDFLRHTKRDSSTISQETIQWFDAKWSSLHTRLEIVPGKEVLHSLRDELQSQYGVSLTTARLIHTCKTAEIPADLVHLISMIDGFRKGSK